MPSKRGKGSDCPPNCGLGKVVHGVVGLTKAVTHIDRASDEVIQHRREVCQKCPMAAPCQNPKNKGKVCTCTKCGCFLKAKTVVAAEKCPEGKWDATTPV